MIDRYVRSQLAELWTLENKFQVWLEVEIAICVAWHGIGKIPTQDLETIKSESSIDIERILVIEETTKHDVIAFLTSLEEKIGASSRFVHLGCTSSDIVDTSNAILLGRAGDIILQSMDNLLVTLKNMVKSCKGVLTMGRTHGIHAEPTTYALKWAGFYSEFLRHRDNFANAVENIRYGKLSGAVGTYTQIPPQIEKTACDLLGLKIEPVATQVVPRDRYAQYFTALALLGGGIERICIELRHLQRTEVLEIEEGFAKGQKGSSAMPHKKNPISAENLTGLSRLLRSNALAAMENMALWHERDISHSSVERVIMPDSTGLADYMLHRLANLLQGLQYNHDHISKNLESSYGLYFSQHLLRALIDKGLKRQEAYELVQAIAMFCWQEKTSFPVQVRKDKKILKYLDINELDKLFSPERYLEFEDEILNRIL